MRRFRVAVFLLRARRGAVRQSVHFFQSLVPLRGKVKTFVGIQSERKFLLICPKNSRKRIGFPEVLKRTVTFGRRPEIQKERQRKNLQKQT